MDLITLIIILVLVIININAAVFYYFYLKKNKISSDEFNTLITSVLYLVSLQKKNYLEEIGRIKKKYDINPNSKTKSLEQFLVESEKILSKYVKLVFSKLSKKNKKKLLNYYSLDGIITIIIEEFKR